jgi:O-antigen ligase
VVPWPALVLKPAPPLEAAYRAAMFRLVGPSRYYSWDPATISGRGSLVERLYATEAAVAMAVKNPLLGVGLDQFGIQYATTYHNPASHFAADSAHTFWPEIAAELGLPALALVVLVFSAALLALWRVYRAPPDPHARTLAGTLLAALAAWLLVATAFAGDMYRPWRNMASDFVMMAVLVAAAFALSRIAPPRASPADAGTGPTPGPVMAAPRSGR